MRVSILILIGLLALVPDRFVCAQSPFPLKMAANKRHLVDGTNKPFLIKEMSAWGLIQALPEKEEEAFLDSIARRGFNAVLTCILNTHSKMTGQPDWQGVQPFHVKWDFTTPNEAYFAHVDRFLQMAAQRNILVMAVPAYLGFRDLPGEGWWDEIKSPNNDSLKVKKFGEFLGKRYRNTPNLLWVAGGDNNGVGDLFPLVWNLNVGIKSQDPVHLWTGHFDSNLGTHWSTDSPLYGKLMDIDGLYVWTETTMFDKGPQYKSELDRYQRGKMIIQLDQSYEHDVPHYADNENDQWIRRKMYDGLLSGCAGTSFSPGTLDNQCYFFKNWQPLMSTPGMRMVGHCFKLFESLAWEKLVPDTGDEIIMSGRGTFGDRDYLCAAKFSDGTGYVAYIPTGRTIFINTGKISKKPLRCEWFNPRTGATLRIGTAGVWDKFGFATPDDHDWVLVMRE